MEMLQVDYEFDLKSNMEIVKAGIEEEIKKYDVLVTDDTLKGAKELMARLNKDKKEFNDTCKSFLDKVSEPITAFKAQQKEIAGLFDASREKIKAQVESFESRKLAEIKEVVESFRDELCESRDIDQNAIIVNDLIKLTAVTSTMKIAKATKEIIESRLQAIENEMLKAKLEAEEKAKRDREIAEEAKLEAEKKAAIREAELKEQNRIALENAEREKKEAIERAEREKRDAIAKANQPAKDSFKQVENVEPDKKVVNIVAKFQVKVPAHIADGQVVSKLEAILRNAGITDESLVGIEVV